MNVRHPDKEAVRAANPILAVAERYGLRPQRHGRAWMVDCPFPAHRHTGRGTPSLALYPDSERFHCFGACGYERPDGDVFDFVGRLRGVDFAAALRELADGGGVAAAPRPRPPRREPPLWQPDAGQRAALETAVEHYHRRLLRSDRVMCYLAGRGLGPEVVRRFRLGYGGPDGGLLAVLQAQGLAATAERLGLVNDHRREFLRWRIVFPDDPQRPTWLIGRKLPWLKRMQLKYLGLPTDGAARPLLFRRPALALARSHAGPQTWWPTSRPWLVLVEGPTDALTLLEWGIPAVALCGTHNGALHRQLPDDLLLFAALDDDAAGDIGRARLAAMDAVPVQLPAAVDQRPVGDVNDLATAPGGREAFLTALDEAWASVR